MRKEFPEVGFDDFPGYAALAADFIRDSGFGIAEFEKFEDARADRVQPEYLPLANVENDGAVLVMGRADLF